MMKAQGGKLRERVAEALRAAGEKIAAEKRMNAIIEEVRGMLNAQAVEFAASNSAIVVGAFIRWSESGIERTGKVLEVKAQAGLNEWALIRDRNSGDASTVPLDEVLEELKLKPSTVLLEVGLYNTTGVEKRERARRWGGGHSGTQETQGIRLDKSKLRLLSDAETQEFLSKGAARKSVDSAAKKLAALSPEEQERLLALVKSGGGSNA